MLATRPSPRLGRDALRTGPGLPTRRQLLAAVLVVAVTVVASTIVSTAAYLRLPAVTGPHAVGRTQALLIDPVRLEPRSATGEHRSVRVIAWYPATAGTGTPAAYLPGLEVLRPGLEASGELGPLEIAGLGSITTSARDSATPVAGDAAFPVILLSPGNATNVAFYGAIAEDLASHGYVVIGLDHPYQVAAVDLGDRGVAVYPGDGAAGPPVEVAAKIDERVADIELVLARLAEDAGGLAPLAGRLDLDRVGVVGHSNGGVAAAEACSRIARVAACMNIDGQAAGGPFAARPGPVAPSKPFLFLTKETELHPALAALFEAAPADAYRVVVPDATHDAFTDGPRFVPRLAPVDGTADAILGIARGFAVAFFDHELREATESVFGSVDAGIDVQVLVYPLGDPDAPRGPLATPTP